MNAGDLVSVIVPVFNVEKYISKCLDSLCGQIYQSIEIITVDDGSSDNSSEIIHRYMEKDKRIRYIKRKNGGLSAARNTGLKACRGNYVCFVDSDDWVGPDYVMKFISTIETDKTDVVISNIRYVFTDGTKRPRTPHIDTHEIISSREALAREFVGKQYRCHAPNKFCRVSLLKENDIWFPEGKLYEDVFTTYKILLAAKSVSLIPEYTYFYLQNRKGSITNTKIKPQIFTDIFQALNLIINDEKCIAYDIGDELQCLYATNVVSLVNFIYPLVGTASRREILYYKKVISSDRHYRMLTEGIIFNKRAGRALKVRAFMIRYCFLFYCTMMQFIKTKL